MRIASSERREISFFRQFVHRQFERVLGKRLMHHDPVPALDQETTLARRHPSLANGVTSFTPCTTLKSYLVLPAAARQGLAGRFRHAC